MSTKRKSKLNEIYELLRNTLASQGIIFNKNQHLAIVTAYCNLKCVPIPHTFTPLILRELLLSTNSPIPISIATVKKQPIKKAKVKKVRQAPLVTSEMSKQQVAQIYQSDLIKFATKHERAIESLLNQINKKITKLEFEFQKIWIETKGKEFYISDFFIPSLNLTLEIDGKSHNIQSQKDKDQRKEDYLLSLGINTVRITNQRVKHLNPTSLYQLLVKSA